MAPNNFQLAKQQLTAPNVMKMVEQRIGEKSGAFVTSVLDLIGSDDNLVKCDPNLVMKEALKAAAIDLPISKTLGFAYVIPYSGKPQFQIGYKGIVQLAIRSGQFRHLNTGIIYEGEEITQDRIRGTMEISGKKTSDKAVAYFAYMQLMNGFEKGDVWTREVVSAHGKRYSKSFKYSTSPWQTNFDEMGQKTMLLRLKAYMPMSIEMATAIHSDVPDNPQEFDQDTAGEINRNANSETLDTGVVDQQQIGQQQQQQTTQKTTQGATQGYGPGQQEPDF